MSNLGRFHGSIPVHTGKPAVTFGPKNPFAVYPRTHGETLSAIAEGHSLSGLSPYTRGNRASSYLACQAARSIPVHTGKPWMGLSGSCCPKVYPRTHGETTNTPSTMRFSKGLSPYTRGNLAAALLRAQRIWSIPVHTGKPDFPPGFGLGFGVYPRTHGETL